MIGSIQHILIVASAPGDRKRLRQMLGTDPQHPDVIIEAESGHAALSLIQRNDSLQFDCVLVCEPLKGITAREFLVALCGDERLPPCPVVMLSDSSPADELDFLRSGAQDCLIANSLTEEILKRAILHAVERHSRSTEHLKTRESDAQFRAMLEAAPDAMVIVDQHGGIVLVNSLTTRMFGYSDEELIGKHVGILLPRHMRDWQSGDRHDFSTDLPAREKCGSLELPGQRKDGSQFPIEVCLSPVETPQGVLISSVIRNVTIRRQIEDQLKKSDAQLRFIMDSMPQMIGTTKPNGEVDYFNPQVTEFTGLSYEQLKSWGWTQFIHPEDIEEHVRAWKRSISSGDAFEFESRFRRFDGVYRWHFSRALPMDGEDGTIVMWVGSNTDIDDIKQAEAALQISEVRYRRLFEAAKDGILILDIANGRIVDSNPLMSDLLGYSHQSFLGKELWEIGLFRDKSANEAAVQTLQESGYLRYEHLPLESKTGCAVEVEIVANAYKEADHQVIQCNIRDITERSRMEKLLQSQASQLENLHLRKDEFLAMLSHELRSPLAPIANAVQLMSLQQDTESKTQHLARNIIERQLAKLQHLVDDLLEVSRITSGRVQLRKEWVAIGGIAQGAVETVSPLIHQKHQELTVSLPVIPLWLSADAARLEQVITNLLTNAAKYTEDGGRIWLTVIKEDNECVIRVRDSGVGISPSLLPQVFDLFTQADRSLDRSQGGLGIGLALVQRLTQLHHGTVEAQSELGHGSEFIVRLPCYSDDSEGAAGVELQDSGASSALRVLVVDDNEDTVLGISLLLEAQGHELCSASSGPEAVRIAAEFRPDLIMLDIGLPGMNGYEVARQIRAQPYGRKVTLIALTGYGRDSDRRASSEAGFDHHLVKPANFEQLLQIMATVDISDRQ